MMIWRLEISRFARKARLAIAICTAQIFLLFSSSSSAAEITIACGPSGMDVSYCFKYAQEWAKKTGHTVRNFSPPSSVPDKLALYRQLFAAKSQDIDILQVDLVWPGLLKDHLIDLSPYTRGEEHQHFKSLIEGNTVNGRLVALPWYTDAGVFYYRKDLLARYEQAVPKTWKELSAVAKRIQSAERARGNPDFHGFMFQGKADEGLTCHALEWIAGSGGGQVLGASGEITIRNSAAASALDTAASWIGDISPLGVLNHEPEDSRGVFQNGNALFMRNWPYAWALMQKDDSPVKGKVGIAPMPGLQASGGRSAVGGWQLGVARYSKHPALAADLVLYMTSAAVQRERAIAGAFNPTRPALYQDKDVIAANPHMPALSEMIAKGVIRPSTITGLKYPQVSQSVWYAAHDVLSGRMSGDEAVARLEKRLERIRRKAWTH
jgi:trehalose/maltose transport system substrate-binding protein